MNTINCLLSDFVPDFRIPASVVIRFSVNLFFQQGTFNGGENKMFEIV